MLPPLQLGGTGWESKSADEMVCEGVGGAIYTHPGYGTEGAAKGTDPGVMPVDKVGLNRAREDERQEIEKGEWK